MSDECKATQGLGLCAANDLMLFCCLFQHGGVGLVKYWDGDRFELILELKAHSADLWALTVSKNGDFLASAGNDKSVRMYVCCVVTMPRRRRIAPQRQLLMPVSLPRCCWFCRWARTDEMVFLEHEQELRAVERMRLEDVGDDSHGMNDAPGGAKGGDGTAIVESSAAVERSLDTVKAAERLMTSLDIVTEEEARVEMLRKTQEAAAKAGGRSSTMKVSNLRLCGKFRSWSTSRPRHLIQRLPTDSQEPEAVGVDIATIQAENVALRSISSKNAYECICFLALGC